MAVLVFADRTEDRLSKGAYEAVNYGHRIAEQLGTNTTAVTYGALAQDTLAGLGEYGADKVLRADLEEPDAGQLARLVAETAGNIGADVIVFSHDSSGKAVAPKVSVKLDAGHVPGAIAEPDTTNGFVVKKNVFSGKAMANVSIKTEKKVVSLLPNAHSIQKRDGSQAEVEDTQADVGEKVIEVRERKTSKGEVSLPEAEKVVSGGRGLKGPENWQIIEDLAGTLGAATACSRPVADNEWRPHHEHVGQTGLTVRPNLYIAVGVSGAIQHLAGVNGSKVMVAINKDEEAPFFKAADYGIVGDAFEVVPKLTEAFKKFYENNN